MSNTLKKPAHKVLLEELEQEFEEMAAVRSDGDGLFHAGCANAVIKVLGRMVIPEERRAEIVAALRRIVRGEDNAGWLGLGRLRVRELADQLEREAPPRQSVTSAIAGR